MQSWRAMGQIHRRPLNTEDSGLLTRSRVKSTKRDGKPDSKVTQSMRQKAGTKTTHQQDPADREADCGLSAFTAVRENRLTYLQVRWGQQGIKLLALLLRAGLQHGQDLVGQSEHINTGEGWKQTGEARSVRNGPQDKAWLLVIPWKRAKHLNVLPTMAVRNLHFEAEVEYAFMSCCHFLHLAYLFFASCPDDSLYWNQSKYHQPGCMANNHKASWKMKSQKQHRTLGKIQGFLLPNYLLANGSPTLRLLVHMTGMNEIYPRERWRRIPVTWDKFT